MLNTVAITHLASNRVVVGANLQLQTLPIRLDCVRDCRFLVAIGKADPGCEIIISIYGGESPDGSDFEPIKGLVVTLNSVDQENGELIILESCRPGYSLLACVVGNSSSGQGEVCVDSIIVELSGSNMTPVPAAVFQVTATGH
jgi:hypothetical protein